MDRHQLGRAAEDAAAAFLEVQGLAIVARNYRRRAGELDIVARDGDTLVVAEVRTRSSAAFGGAAASVNFRKQSKLLRAATQLLQQRRDLRALYVRFDVLVVSGLPAETPRVEWIQHAFTA